MGVYGSKSLLRVFSRVYVGFLRVRVFHGGRFWLLSLFLLFLVFSEQGVFGPWGVVLYVLFLWLCLLGLGCIFLLSVSVFSGFVP